MIKSDNIEIRHAAAKRSMQKVRFKKTKQTHILQPYRKTSKQKPQTHADHH